MTRRLFPKVVPGIVLCLIILLALVVRLASYRNFANPEGGFFFYSTDAYDHLRRITLGIQNFPAIPLKDSYAGYPVGLDVIWSPVYDYVISIVCMLLGGSRQVVETVGFLANPLLAGFAAVIMFYVARRTLGSTAAGLVATFYFVMNPGNISYSMPMNFDHHVIEPIIVMMLFAMPLRERAGRLDGRATLTQAGVLVLAVLLWRGSTLYWCMAFAVLAARLLYRQNRLLAKDYATSFLAAGVVTGLFCSLTPLGLNTFSFSTVSWFHVTVLLACSATLGLYGWSPNTKWFLASLTFCLALIAILSLLPPVKSVFLELLKGISFLQRSGDAWLATNSEQLAVFSVYDFWFGASALTVAWFLTPLAALLAIYRWREGGKQDDWLLTFALWSPLFLMGMILRYVHVAAVISSLAAALLFLMAWERWKSAGGRAVATGVMIALFLPSTVHTKSSMSSYLLPNLRFGLHGNNGILEWIRRNTLPTSYHLSPVKVPEYGILADWELGSRIYHIAQRPALATGFGWETNGLYQQAGFWVCADPARAMTILRENRVRYIIVRRGKHLPNDLRIALEGEAKRSIPTGTVTPNTLVEQTMYNRLLYQDGSVLDSSVGTQSALGNYRLVYESEYLGEQQDTPQPVSYYKLFEVVPGAVITGNGRPGEKVEIALRLETTRKRVFEFRDVTTVNRDGRFRIHVPYSTQVRQGDTMPMGQYVISIAGRASKSVTISERDILAGNVISL